MSDLPDSSFHSNNLARESNQPDQHRMEGLDRADSRLIASGSQIVPMVNGFASDVGDRDSQSSSSSSTLIMSQSSATTQTTISSTQQSTSASSVTISSQSEDIDLIDEEEIVTSTDDDRERSLILQDLITCRRNYRQRDEEPYYDVAAIVNHSVRPDGSRWYKIRWAGYGPDSDSWVRSTDLNCPRRLAQYFYLRRLYEVQPMDFSDSDSSS